jgi:hypothetical protein
MKREMSRKASRVRTPIIEGSRSGILQDLCQLSRLVTSGTRWNGLEVNLGSRIIIRTDVTIFQGCRYETEYCRLTPKPYLVRSNHVKDDCQDYHLIGENVCWQKVR